MIWAIAGLSLRLSKTEARLLRAWSRGDYWTEQCRQLGLANAQFQHKLKFAANGKAPVEHELRKAREELVKLDWYKAEVKRLDMLIEIGAEISEEFSRGAQAMKLLDEIVESEVLLEGPGGGNQCLHDRAVAIISEEGAA